jgi:ankyrin repeat protein
LPVIKLLHTHSANLLAEDSFGVTPLQEALKNNHQSVAEFLQPISVKDTKHQVAEEAKESQQMVEKFTKISKGLTSDGKACVTFWNLPSLILCARSLTHSLARSLAHLISYLYL